MSEFLITIICIIIFYYNRKIIKENLKKKIQSVNIESVHEIFEPVKISDNLLGPGDDLIIQSFILISGLGITKMATKIVI